ncbi:MULTISPECIES: YbhB/YbcL family Raf kinase inhibitor-like protein [Candidatus Ichthyocystis]|uniref:Putative phosphatidylethanolamine-binding family protein n=1 Tax=Candidatus Ichthyocystis hellenicum TaxID=1561003 RepID=A0A0S4M5F4_9BURK|nr:MULTISPECIES: YbhB/YbcL family Raf kinase inhibitor-like protein [Ichthyocystis]CUT18204.1 putative phosphatidylethanolamine-binding family protein [Candidatus Ichthyocystis hellenicum]
MMARVLSAVLFCSMFFSQNVLASRFSLHSADMATNKIMNIKQVFNRFGCHGGNLSPQLSWSYEPVGTKSFAITVYDPDAPTISGWWHWLLVDIPPSVHNVDTGASSLGKLPKGSFEIRNDYGLKNFGGPCPPSGEKRHRYIFTVWALKVSKLPIKKDSTAAMAGFSLVSNSIGKAELVPFYRR